MKKYFGPILLFLMIALPMTNAADNRDQRSIVYVSASGGAPAKYAVLYGVDGKNLPKEQAIPIMKKRMKLEEFLALKTGLEYFEENVDKIANPKVSYAERKAIIEHDPYTLYLGKDKKEKTLVVTHKILSNHEEVLDKLRTINQLKAEKASMDNKTDSYRIASRQLMAIRKELETMGYFSMEPEQRAALEMEAR